VKTLSVIKTFVSIAKVNMENHPRMLEETWLANLIQESGNEIFIIDACTLAILEASEAVRRNLQYSARELVTMSAPQIMRDLTDEQLHQFVGRLRAGGEPEIITHTAQLRRDGSLYEVTLRLSFAQLQDVSALIAVSVAPRIERSPVSREDRFAQIEAHVPGLLFQMRRGATGLLQFSFLSQACHDLLGQPAEALYANPARFLALIAEEDRSSWATALRESATTLSVLNWEGRIWIEAWQDTKWINLRASPRDEGENGIQWTGLMTNITLGRKLQHEISESRRQLADMSAHVEQAKEQERERIERDLHDDLGGNLSALKMMLEHVWNQIPQTPYLAERRDYLNELLDRSIESIHRISADLRPGILDAGLVAALEWLAQEQQEQTGVPYRFRCNHADIALDAKVATSLFRVAQEACNNIRKHAQASWIEMQLFDDGDELLMEIIDNGVGMEGARRDSPRSFGLRGMAERMNQLGGEFSIVSRPGKGTVVTARLPLEFGRTAVAT
jgi:two-component system sensor histidine kinase UhpB